MHEVVHISHGPQANYLTSAFLNRQKSYFVYSKEDIPKSHIDPSIRFVAGKQYTPRALFWDFRNGFGRLKKISDKYETVGAIDSQDTEQLTSQKLPDGDYWTDSLQVPLHPTSLYELPDWEFDPINFPQGRLRGSTDETSSTTFSRYEYGVEEYNSIVHSSTAGGGDDYLDNSLRKTLEQCDLLSGINLNTSLGGWTGFSSALLEPLRDDYVPNKCVISWASIPEKSFLSRPQTDDFLESMLQLSEFSDVVVPMNDTLSGSTEDMVQTAKRQLPSFETFCLMASLRKDPVPMFSLTEKLVGQGTANIVSCSELLLPQFASPDHIQSRVQVVRAGYEDEAPVTLNDEIFDEHAHNLDAEVSTRYVCPQPFNHEAKSHHELVLTSGPLSMRKLVGPRDHRMKERIYELTEPYIWRWQDSDESD